MQDFIELGSIDCGNVIRLRALSVSELINKIFMEWEAPQEFILMSNV